MHNTLLNRLPLLLLSLLLIALIPACTSGLNSGHIISVTDRVFGFDLQTATVDNGTPRLRVGFVSTSFVLEPTVTNQLLVAPNMANTFALDNTGSPFALGVNETFASGTYATGNLFNTNVPIASQPLFPPIPVPQAAASVPQASPSASAGSIPAPSPATNAPGFPAK